jgi:L-ribulose-5-phosphate 4-epimerase
MSQYSAIKEECCDANRLLPALGLVDLTFGNVSVFDPALGVFAIKPSGVAYAQLRPEDMVVVDLEGRQVEGALRFSSDTPTHRCLFRGFPEVRAIVHTHSRHAVAFAQAGRPIPCFGTTHADHFYGEIPVTEPMTPEEITGAYEWETGNVILRRFRNLNPLDIPAVIVHGHGPFAWGASAAHALENAQALEIIASIAQETLQLNPHATPIPRALLDKHFLRKHGAAAYYGQETPLGQ